MSGSEPRAQSVAYPIGLRSTEGRNQRLRSLLADPEIVVAPGCFDCLSGRLLEEAGFAVGYVTGSGVSISQLGAPDVNLASFSEVLDRVKRIADAVTIPLIADIDTGFGGPLNIIRTVREFERAGVSAVQLEDQQAPKKCGHELGRCIVAIAEMTGRIKAAVDARCDSDFLIIARTDARTSLGLDAALERADAYISSGADVLFVESPENESEMRAICGHLGDRAPTLANMVEGGRTPILPVSQLEEIGFKMAIFPNALTRAFAYAGRALLQELSDTGTTNGFRDRMLDHNELWSLFDYTTWLDLERDFSPPNKT